MKTKVLIAHAKGEEKTAELLAEPIRDAGYDVAHEGTVLIGDSIIGEASKLLAQGAPVVICGTVRAMGTKWAKQLANAARAHDRVRMFVVQMEEDADVEAVSFDEAIAQYWKDPKKAQCDLLAALNKYYTPDSRFDQIPRATDLEARFRDLTLKACDIIDLANLPQDDRHLATRELELRRLYVPLRVRETSAQSGQDGRTGRENQRSYDSADELDPAKRVSVGEQLKELRRLVVLGDPGAGKSTLLRWVATAFLLRLKQDPDWRNLPDLATLPDEEWLPILIRCRDLPPETATLNDMLYHSLRKLELGEHECNGLREYLRERLKQGTALLLVDGLDEITEPTTRVRFAQQLARIHRVHPDAPMIVTSRIVGYREMGYRIREGFAHLTVTDLNKEDKDDFAHRWCALTERGERRELAAEELIRDIHSSDRIERLTGNPMLLTTMALIKRKIGKLPQRRVDLYEKTTEVLLNWRSAVEAALDPREALPQLKYLAYAMCERGVQQLREDEVLDLLHRARTEYPQIHPMRQHGPEEFLALLERRTGLVVQSGYDRHRGQTLPVYEFRHLTIQEYLAGIAIVQGHFPNRDRDKTLAQNIAPLAGRMSGSEERSIETDANAAVNWREALRLCVAACNDDDVDSVLSAILTPLPGEAESTRTRVGLAAHCLADEPNVSDPIAKEILQLFVACIEEPDGDNMSFTMYERVAQELSGTRWHNALHDSLAQELFSRKWSKRRSVGGVLSFVIASTAPSDDVEFAQWLAMQAGVLKGSNAIAATCAALGLMHLAFLNKKCGVPEIVSGLMSCLDGPVQLSHAAIWSLWWLNKHEQWQPSKDDLLRFIAFAAEPECEPVAAYFAVRLLEKAKSSDAIDVFFKHITSPEEQTRNAASDALGAIGGTRSAAKLGLLVDRSEDREVRLAALRALIEVDENRAVATFRGIADDNDSDIEFRKTATGYMARAIQDECDRKLLARDFDGFEPFVDPQVVVSRARTEEAARTLEKSVEEVRRRYEFLADRFGLMLEWQ